MIPKHISIATIGMLALTFILISSGVAQHGGSRSTSYDASDIEMATLDTESVSSHIQIEGTSQKRVKPTDLRLIWAVTSEAEDSPSCLKQIEARIANVITAWNAVGITRKEIVEDFISIIPVYEWQAGERNGKQILIEELVRYRIQSNLHVAVKSDRKAMQVIKAAVSAGLTDLIGVDYSADLAAAQRAARMDALEAAKEKAGFLFGTLFDSAPAPINIQEKSKTHFPSNMYESFQNSSSQTFMNNRSRDLPRLSAYRPQNTYYRGRTVAADAKSYALPMNPEIIVESKVVIYYASPGNHSKKKQGDDSTAPNNE